MANLSLIRVNQKLAQAKLLLTEVEEHSLTAVHRTAILEGTTFHLVCAYHHYLREIAETYGLKNVGSFNSEADLSNAFQVADKHPVEAEELLTLRREKTSWLVHLHDYYDSLWRAPIPPVPQDESLIKLVDVTQLNDVKLVDFETVRDWQQEFVALVLRQRETSAEF